MTVIHSQCSIRPLTSDLQKLPLVSSQSLKTLPNIGPLQQPLREPNSLHSCCNSCCPEALGRSCGRGNGCTGYNVPDLIKALHLTGVFHRQADSRERKHTIGMHIRTFRILKQSSFVCNESCSFCGPVISSALLLKISLLSLFEAICYEMPNCGFLEIPLYQHSLDSSKV